MSGVLEIEQVQQRLDRGIEWRRGNPAKSSDQAQVFRRGEVRVEIGLLGTYPRRARNAGGSRPRAGRLRNTWPSLGSI